jgi:hypothetical protein
MAYPEGDGTWLDLDEPRTVLSEQAFSFTKFMKDVDERHGARNRVYKWHTGSFTLFPVNLLAGFAESPIWEGLKFRLENPDPGMGVIYNPDYLVERPLHSGAWKSSPNGAAQFLKWDYYFETIIKSENYTPPDNAYVLAAYNHLVAIKRIEMANEAEYGVAILESAEEMPLNQGYMIRFFNNGKASDRVGSMFEFWFGGRFMLRIQSTGVCFLYQAPDPPSGGVMMLVAKFNWTTKKRATMGDHHEFIIFPHGRRQIEFQFLDYSQDRISPSWEIDPPERRGFIYTLPTDPEYMQDGTGRPIIAWPAKWQLVVSRRYRHRFQISKLGFYQGDPPAGAATESRIFDRHFELPSSPVMPVRCLVDGDLNNPPNVAQNNRNRVDWEILAADGIRQDGSIPPFQSQPGHRMPEVSIRLRGRRDIKAKHQTFALYASLTTPEIYSYTLDKGCRFEVVAPTVGHSTRVMSVQLDTGDSPESMRGSALCDNGDNQLHRYRRRAEIPYKLRRRKTVPGENGGEPTTKDITLAEGQIVEVRHNKTVRPSPKLEFEMRGMADRLLRTYPLDLDFTADPTTDQKKDPIRGWKWQQALKKCFETGGFDSDHQVIFDDVPVLEVEQGGEDLELKYKPAADFDFRLWADGDTGGTRGGKNSSGDGSTPGQRWRPNPKAPIYQFIDYLTRQVMGWHFDWDLERHAWVIWKRPRPDVLAAIPPKVRFVKTPLGMTIPDPLWPDLPTYTHSALTEDMIRPECTTAVVITKLLLEQRMTKQELRQAMVDAAQGKGLGASVYVKKPKLVAYEFDNANGYANDRTREHMNDPEWMGNNPDWLASKRIRLFPIWEAGSRDAIEWMGRRIYEDNCFGQVFCNFSAYWGDEITVPLRKWDKVRIDDEDWVISRVEPQWKNDRVIRARYRCSLFRAGVPPPR